MDAGSVSFGSVSKTQSSLSLAILLFFDYYLSILWFVVELLLFAYKGNVLPYPPGSLASEVAMLFFWMIAQLTRLHIGTAGNKTERPNLMTWFLGLSLPVLFFTIYIMALQIYVLRLEMALTVFQVFFVASETLIALPTMCYFRRAGV
eukprot:GDKH01004491.1.p1 GENE.GDKH01004491.1~~GDKH01004491.1.p1  ORF type:complete len:148 (-),score=6.41 GDKH01004491.1:123-566(-)